MTAGTLQCRKRAFLGSLLSDFDVIAIQETRGTEADLSTLPHSHKYVGTFGITRAAGTSSEGGTIIGIRSTLFARITEHITKVHRRGRAITWSIRTASWTHFTSIHVDVTETMLARKNLLSDIHRYCEQRGGRSFIMGDFNFVVSGDSRLQGDGTHTYSQSHLADHFEAVFSDYCELMQHDFTFRRLARDSTGPSTFSRIDRVYSSLHPTAFEDYRVQVTVRGGWERGKAASDHRAVTLRLDSRTAPGRRRIRQYVAQHPDFPGTLAEEELLTNSIDDPGIRYESIVSNAFAAQCRILPRLSTSAAETPQYVVDRGLAVFRAIRAGNGAQSIAIASEVEPLRRCVKDGALDIQRLGETFQDALDSAVTLEINELERSKQPELQKAPKRQRLKVRMEPYRVRRKRLALDGVYNEDGEALTDPKTVSAAIVAEWAPAFMARATDAEDMRWFLNFAPHGAGSTDWTWPHGKLRSVAAHMPKSAPGPDGLTYAFWSCATDGVLQYLDSVAEAATHGEPLPSILLRSYTVFIPKGEYEADIDRIIRRVKELRPIVLMQTSAKIIAAIGNAELADIAQRTVSCQQRGFVPGRQLADNVISVEGGLFEFTQLHNCLPAVILLDFAQAFPSLSHTWLFAVLEEIGINPYLRNLILALYNNLVTTVYFGGCELDGINITSGIKQGCPLSGSIFAIAADPLIRAYLAATTMQSSRIGVFADDIALALRHLDRHLGIVMHLFRRWRGASGLSLKVSKCCIVMGTDERERYEAALASCPDAHGMQLSTHAVYLGIDIGPAGPAHQWQAVQRKIASCTPDAAGAPSLTGRTLLFNTHIASLLMFKAQLTDLSTEVIRIYTLASQRITKSPYMAISPAILYDLKALGMPLEVRDPQLLAAAARVGVLRRSAVWQEVEQSIREASSSDAARLNPHCSWHATSVIGVLRRTQAWLQQQPGDLRQMCEEKDTKQIIRALRGPTTRRREVIAPTLMRRMRRWSDNPAVAMARLYKFVDENPPVELICSVLRTLLYGWCTSGRFNHPLQNCRFCDAGGCDRQQHYLACPNSARWMCERMLYAHTPATPHEHGFFLEQLGCGGDEAMRAAVTLDALLHAFDAKRHGASGNSAALMDARLKEGRRRHRAIRRLPLGML